MRLRLSLYWLFATGALGVFFPYFTLYLRENIGLGGQELGLVMAIPPLVGSIAQPLWGQLADRSGSRTRTLSILALCAAFGYAGLALPHDFASVAVATVLLAVFSTPLVPIAMSVTLGALSDQGPLAFGRVRVWGTLGFLVAVVGCPPLLGAVEAALGLRAEAGGPSRPGLHLIFLLGALLLIVASRMAARLPGHASLSLRASRGDLGALLRHRGYRKVLVFVFGSYLFLHGPMFFFPVYVRERGGSMEHLSYLWILMLSLEVPLMIYSGNLFERIGARAMVAIATFAGGLRWVVCALSPSLAFAAPVQLLHAFTVAGLIVGASLHIDATMPPALRSTAQAGLTMTGANLGGIASSTLCGAIFDRHGIDAIYLFGGVGAALWALTSLLLLPGSSRSRVAPAEILASERGTR
ncbi:MAG: MFS transporter [Myxococcales bacterium]|nr:MFS transporter [Myxococcales bacterium]